MLWLISSWMVMAAEPEVVISRSLYTSLLPPRSEAAPKAPPSWARHRELELTLDGDTIELVGRWDLSVPRKGWVDLGVLSEAWEVEAITLDGVQVPLRVADGTIRVVAELSRDVRLEVRARRAGHPRKGIGLDLLGATTGTVRVRTSDALVQLSDDRSLPMIDDRFWTGASHLRLATVEERPSARSGLDVVGRVGIGITVGDAAIRTSARVQYEVRSGRLSLVELVVPRAGRDLRITGPLVKRWTRRGERVVVELTRATESVVALQLGWSTALERADQLSVPLPEIQLVGTYRTEQTVQIARDGDREILPMMKGWTGIPRAQLPPIGRGLVEGTPTSSWTSTGASASSLSLLRFKPVSGPSTVVDVAAYNGALSRDGRLLLRVHYTVRNDRGSFLRVQLQPDQRLISARVGGEPARVARDGDTLLLPLLKSLETVQGLLDFPVELVFLEDGAPFQRRVDREVQLPVIDAPIAVSRIELVLPVGWTNALELGEAYRVDTFSEGEGISYGLKADDSRVAVADALYQDALQAWMSNDFDEAQVALDDLRQLGADNKNVSRLQSNLDVVLGGAEADADDALGRRVKDQARARAVDEERAQVELEEEADELLNAGEYEQAVAVYGEALKIGQKLERLEQSESREVAAVNVSLSGKMKKATEFKKRTKRSSKAGMSRTTEFVFKVPSEPKPAGEYVMMPPDPPPLETPMPVERSRGVHSNMTSRGPILTEEITATNQDVVLPTFGEVVRYQHLILPAGASPDVVLRAKAKRGNR